MQNVFITQISPSELNELIYSSVQKALQNSVPAKTTESEVLTIKEAAKLLHCSVPTLYSKHSKGELPGVSKVGKRLLFNRQILLDWINEKQQKTVAQIKAEAHCYLVNKKEGVK